MPAADVKLTMVPGTKGVPEIHFLIKDPAGPIGRPQVVTDRGPLTEQPFRGRIACMPNLASDETQRRGNQIILIKRTDQPDVVTCLRCKATAEHRDALALVEKATVERSSKRKEAVERVLDEMKQEQPSKRG